MDVKVRKLNNGYLIENVYHNGEVMVDDSIIIEEEDGEFGDLESFRRLCWELMDVLSVNNSKHRGRRVSIEVSPEVD
jgi:hypothetical protein